MTELLGSLPAVDAMEGAGSPLDLTAVVAYYQPFYNLQSGRLQGLEALARPRTQDGRGPLPAGFFAAAAEQGLMLAIDRQILHDALEHVALWHRADAPELIISVNLSWDFVGHPGVVDEVTRPLERHGVEPDRLLVDVPVATFRRLLAADGIALGSLCRLQERAIAFCLDGFTAADLDVLERAAQVPVDIIKLHPRQLTAGALPELSALAQAIHDVEMPIVAAGIETADQLDLVRDLGFEWAQGFYLGEPVPAQDALSAPRVLPAR